jgi:hypothetical protein
MGIDYLGESYLMTSTYYSFYFSIIGVEDLFNIYLYGGGAI